MTIRMKAFAGMLAAVAALTLATVSVYAEDYSTQITAGAADLTADLIPTLAAVAVVAIGVIALFKGLTLALKGFRRVG